MLKERRGWRLRKVPLSAGGWVYHAVFCAPGLPRRQRCLGTPNEREAKRRAAELLERVEFGFARCTGEATGWRLSEMWARHLALAGGKKAAALRVDAAGWKSLTAATGDCRVGELTRDKVRLWLASMAGAGLASASITGYLAACRRIWRGLEGLVEGLQGERSPFTGVRSPKLKHEGQKRPFTPEQVREILTATKKEELDLYHLALICSATGLRLGDACSLLWDSVDLHGRSIKLRQRKTGRAVELPISDALLKHFSGLKRRGLAVWPELAASYPTVPGLRLLCKRFKRVLNRLGYSRRESIPGRKRLLTVLGWHSFRHYVIKELCRAKVPIGTVQAISGHASPAMVIHYSQQVSLEEKLSAVREALRR